MYADIDFIFLDTDDVYWILNLDYIEKEEKANVVIVLQYDVWGRGLATRSNILHFSHKKSKGEDLRGIVFNEYASRRKLHCIAVPLDVLFESVVRSLIQMKLTDVSAFQG